MEALKQEIRKLLAQAGAGASLDELAGGFVDALQRHPGVLGSLEGRYRLQTTDTGFCCSFALSAEGCQTLGEQEPVDAVISGREADLLSVLRREVKPMAAVFAGKIRVRGSMQALRKFTQLL